MEKRKLINKEVLNELMKEGKLKDVKDIQNLLKEQFKDVISEMLQAEMDNHLGYTKYDYKNKNTNNSRNGNRKKKIKTDYGEMEVEIPRDRFGEHEPIVIKKNQRDVSGIEDQVLGMYSMGMSTRDIQNHLNNIYGIEVSPSLISQITDRIMPIIKEWQRRPLQRMYVHLVLDAMHYKVRQEGKIVNKAVYIIIGTDIDGMKEILGMWIGEQESSKFRLKVLTDIQNRGVEEILIASIDGLNGFKEAIKTVFIDAKVQRCIVHMIRNSTKYLSYKDRRSFINDLKPVYKAINEESALDALNLLEEKWGEKYYIAIKPWRDNWEEISVMFEYPEEIRRLIYTTNSIESFNRQLRKVTKTKSVFPNDDSLMKILYLSMMNIIKKWNQRVRNWAGILGQLSIIFGDRISKYL